MHIKIRLSGAKGPNSKKLQQCRIVVSNVKRPRDGLKIEDLGIYNKRTKLILLNRSRVGYWLSVGAVPTDAVKKLLGILGEFPCYTKKAYEFNKYPDKKTTE